MRRLKHFKSKRLTDDTIKYACENLHKVSETLDRESVMDKRGKKGKTGRWGDYYKLKSDFNALKIIANNFYTEKDRITLHSSRYIKELIKREEILNQMIIDWIQYYAEKKIREQRSNKILTR